MPVYVSLTTPFTGGGDMVSSNNLSDVTNAVIARSNIGAQASDAKLTAIAGLTGAADKVPYFTGSGTAALADLTSTARSLLDDVSTSAMRTTLGVREKLTGNRTYYVRTDGSDSNDGLTNSAAGAFLTWQKAVDVVHDTIDIAGYTCTIQIGNGTYTAGITRYGSAVGGIPVLQGDTTTPSNVVLSVTNPSAAAIDLRRGCRMEMKGFKITVATFGYAFHISSLATLLLTDKMEYGTCASGHITSNHGDIAITGDYTISGNAPVHLQITNNGTLQWNCSTVTLSGTPAFSTATVAVYRGGEVQNAVTTFSGSATGSRFLIDSGGIIYGDVSAIPGNAAGSYTGFWAKTSSTGNSEAGETTLWQVSVPAMLYNDGNALEFVLEFTTAANANSKTPRVKFGATTFASTSNSMNNGILLLRGRIQRTGASTQVAHCAGILSTNNITLERGTPGETLSGAVNFTVTGQGTSTNDLVLQSGSLRFVEA